MNNNTRIVIIGATSAIAEHCARLWVQDRAVDLVLVARDQGRAERIAADLRVRSPQSTVQVLASNFLDAAAIEGTAGAAWGGVLGAGVGGNFLPWLLFYFALTCAYSWGLKRLVLVDCLTLAMLYTLRIVAGAAAAGIALSFWLQAFSVFLFLSLSFVKRYAELQVQILAGKQKVHGRGYLTSDAPLIQMLGITAAMRRSSCCRFT